MSWFSHKSTKVATAPGRALKRPIGPRIAVPQEVQERIAEFLVKSGRHVQSVRGHSRLMFLGTTSNIDGSTDYQVRTFIRGEGNKEEIFNSHVRVYATEHIRLVR